MWRRLNSKFARFCRDRSGAVVLLFGLVLLPIVTAVGVAVDYGRALTVKEQIGNAIDAAALAVGSSLNLSEAQAQAQAQSYFDANFPPGQSGVSVNLTVSATDDTVSITADGSVDTTFMKLAGFDHLSVSAFTEVTRKHRNVELVMVLDNTGSMSWSGKIDALKSAATTLTDILYDGAEPGETKFGLVPFAAAVNIGADKLASGWLDTNAQSAIATEDFAPGVNPLTLYDGLSNRTWNGCVRARVAPHDTSDTAPSGGNVATLWAPYFAPDEPDFWWYYNRYRNDGAYGGDYYDYDARQRFTGKYTGSLPSWEDDGPDFNCRTPAITALTSTKSEVTDAINAMVATGSTVIPAGLSWGWRVISPGAPYTEGVAYDDEDTIKAIVLLTDGQNSIGGGLGNHNFSYYSAYGFAQSGHMGATNGIDAESTLDSKTSTLCTNIKAQGILLYTVTFQLADGPIKDLMRNCATKEAMYFDSPSNDQLTTVFQQIAVGLSELRISK